MTVTSFPQHKSLEKYLRELDEQGRQLKEVASQLRTQIDNWEEAYVRLGNEYVQSGGSDPEILAKIFTVVKTKELFGAYII